MNKISNNTFSDCTYVTSNNIFRDCVFVTANGGGSKSKVTLKSILREYKRRISRFVKNFYIFKNYRY